MIHDDAVEYARHVMGDPCMPDSRTNAIIGHVYPAYMAGAARMAELFVKFGLSVAYGPFLSRRKAVYGDIWPTD